MKNVTITPKKLDGSIVIPPSKSLCHRAIICASLAKGVSKIENVGYSDDINATIEAMQTLGAKITRKEDVLFVDGSETLKKGGVVDCVESGSTLRFLIPLALHIDDETTFTGRGRLPERPLDSYYKIFDKFNIKYKNTLGKLPLTMGKGNISGAIEIEGNVSSQFISGLLFALPLFPESSEIKMQSPLESKAYIDLTIDVMKTFGVEVYNNNYHTFKIKGGQQYKCANYRVEGDFSQAAFFLAAGALGSFVICKGLNINSMQGDKEIIEIIERMGGEVVCEEDSISAMPANLKGIRIDASQIPDLVPIITVLAALAEGETEIYNAGRLRIKESDRLSAIAKQLNTLGAVVIEKKNGLLIEGVKNFCGGTTNSENDHRIAMSVAIASTCADEIVAIENSEAVNKSYPDFWKDFGMLGGEVDEWNVG